MKEVELSTLQKNDILVGSSKVTLKEVLHENKGNGMKKTYEYVLNAAFTLTFSPQKL
jgi:hypothetical protein